MGRPQGKGRGGKAGKGGAGGGKGRKKGSQQPPEPEYYSQEQLPRGGSQEFQSWGSQQSPASQATSSQQFAPPYPFFGASHQELTQHPHVQSINPQMGPQHTHLLNNADPRAGLQSAQALNCADPRAASMYPGAVPHAGMQWMQPYHGVDPEAGMQRAQAFNCADPRAGMQRAPMFGNAAPQQRMDPGAGMQGAQAFNTADPRAGMQGPQTFNQGNQAFDQRNQAFHTFDPREGMRGAPMFSDADLQAGMKGAPMFKGGDPQGGMQRAPMFDNADAQMGMQRGHGAVNNPDPRAADPRAWTQQQRPYVESSGDGLPSVVMVAEKPSVAKMISEHLSGGRMRMRKGLSRACQIYEFTAYFPPARQKCRFLQTSVVGHVFGLDFTDNDNTTGWEDPSILYDARVEKTVERTTSKLRIIEHLQDVSRGAQYLVLWLDCDREGENIGFEVISICRADFPTDGNIYRAQFSALTETEMRRALNTLGRPNRFMSMAVDARQELDLKIGVSFTRLLTQQLLADCKEKFYPDLRVISYGPCQTPTLWFCVQRHHEIQAFESQIFWAPKIVVEVPSLGRREFEWSEGTTFDPQQVQDIVGLCRAAGVAVVGEVTEEQKTVRRPVGLNTVQLLKAASAGMGMSPVTAMKAAEHLYTSGYISYPRTESTKYPASFDVAAALREQAQHPNWGRTANYILSHNRSLGPPPQGHDAGDHPPITPVRSAPRSEIARGKEWQLYDYITRHFIGSLMDDFQYREHRLRVAVGGSLFFTYTWHTIQERGFFYAMPWKQNDLKLNEVAQAPRLLPGQQLPIGGVTHKEDYTRPPDYLKESELIALMDQKGIGTDASIPQHVQNILDRRYATVCGPGEGGKPGKPILTDEQMWKMRKRDPHTKQEQPKSRHMVPTGLGLALINGYDRVDRELCEPQVRAFMEQQVAQIADGTQSQDEVLRRNLELFHRKFLLFRQQLGVIEPLFRPPQRGGGSYRDHGSGSGHWEQGVDAGAMGYGHEDAGGGCDGLEQAPAMGGGGRFGGGGGGGGGGWGRGGKGGRGHSGGRGGRGHGGGKGGRGKGGKRHR